MLPKIALLLVGAFVTFCYVVGALYEMLFNNDGIVVTRTAIILIIVSVIFGILIGWALCYLGVR